MKNKLNLILIVFITLFFYFIAFMVASGRLSLNVMLLYVTLSIVTFFLYMKDKSAAKSHDWRIKERTLFLFGLLGGWPGALFAQRVFHHKTQKTQFQLIYWLTVVINCGGLATLIYI